MKIAVSSALHGQPGNSTVALFLAHALSLTQRQNICLTHADFGNPTLMHNVGLEPEEDMTRSLSHVAKMLKNNMLTSEELPDYAMKVFDGLDLYSTDKLSIDLGELMSFYSFLLGKMTSYNHIVIDVDTGIKSEVSELALTVSDVLVIPVTHNLSVIKKSKEFKENLLHELAKKRKRRELTVYYCLNHYDSNIATYKKVAALLGVRPSSLLTIHSNPEFIKAANNGKMSDILAGALTGRNSVMNLRADMKVCCKVLLGKEFVWADPKKRR